MKICHLSKENIFNEWKCHLSKKNILANENMSSNENIFSEWKYVVYLMKICHLSNENIFSEWKYVVYRMKICHLSNENIFCQILLLFGNHTLVKPNLSILVWILVVSFVRFCAENPNYWTISIAAWLPWEE